jgi:hypothetical protein
LKIFIDLLAANGNVIETRGNIGIPNRRPINLLPEYRCFNKEWGQGRVSNSCSISGTLRCNLVTHPVISHE